MSSDQPNVLLLMTDQHRADALGIEGHSVLQTPYLDYLAASGIRCSRAYSACPVCTPARRTLITGQSALTHGCLRGPLTTPLPDATLPRVLGRAGYQTHLVGKAHYGDHHRPEGVGFETMDWADTPRMSADSDYANMLRANGHDGPDASQGHGISNNGWTARPWHLDETLHYSYWAMDRAMRFLAGRDRSRPFFLKVSLVHPHQPLTPPRFYYDKYMQMDLPELPVGDWARVFDGPVRGLPPQCARVCLDPPVLKQYQAAYYGSIEHADNQFGRLFIDKAIADNTIVIFCSDHGEMLGEHQWIRKTVPFEGSARIPLLMRFPRQLGVEQGRSIDQLVELRDVMPTILDALEMAIPDTVEGESLMPLLRDQATPWRTYLHGEHPAVESLNSGMQFITDAQCKYVWFPALAREHLFNLAQDPQECHDLSGCPQWQDRLQAMRTLLARELAGRPEGFSDGECLLQLSGPTL